LAGLILYAKRPICKNIHNKQFQPEGKTTMRILNIQPSNAGEIANSAQQNSSRSIIESTRISASREQSMDMILVTTEGDRVTLSASSLVRAAYASYAGYMETGGSSAWTQGMSLSQNAFKNFSISIEGDLSKEELKDIFQVMTRIDKIMREMLDGDMDDALRHALKLNKFDSISSLQANLQFSQSVVVDRQTASQSQTTIAETDSANIQPASFAMADVGRLLEDMIKIVEESTVQPDHLLQPVAAVFKRLFTDVEAMDDDDAEAKRQLAGLLTHDLMEKMKAGKPAHGHDD
jgi:hypothetical protein